MDSTGLRNRVQEMKPETPDLGAGATLDVKEPHPAGPVKHGLFVQVLRGMLTVTWFIATAFAILSTQIIGSPLYFWNKDYYYAYMALTKQSFGIVSTAISQTFCPTPMKVSWDSGLDGQFKKAGDGRLETTFPERMILISNHQIYTDWLYLWWIAYTSKMHGHLFIILKESLKYVPMLGQGMMFYGFIFMARKWVSDKPRMEHRLQKLKTRHKGPMSGGSGDWYDPMWLLIFPEGTNLSANTRKKSVAWSQQSGIPDMKHQLLPRATGLHFCLEQLKGTVDWVYDCTIAYEGVPAGGYAQDYFTLRSTWLQGRTPKSVSLHWRRFAVAEIPLDDQKQFEKWLDARWREKDEMLDQFNRTGRFPAANPAPKDASAPTTCIDTEVRLKSLLEIGQVYVVLAAFALLVNLILKAARVV